MKVIQSISVIFLIIFFVNNIKAQETGSFAKQLLHEGENRNVAFYVPDDYSETEKYPLIIGMHPGGSSGTSMRMMMKPAAETINAILACPDDNQYILNNPGTIITTVLEYVKENYNIDDNMIVITGYSMGGHATFHYGFKHYKEIAGIIGMAPAVSNASYLDYSITKEFPVGLIIGSEDDFMQEATEIKTNIENAGGKLKYIEKEGVTHMDNYFWTNEFTTDWMECFYFIKGGPEKVDNTDYITAKCDIHPNPVVNISTLTIEIEQEGYYNFSVYTLPGQETELFSSKFLKKGVHIFEFNGESLLPGAYFYCLQGQGSRYLGMVSVL